MSMFQKAKKQQAKFRGAFIGISGSGKTRSALEVAKGLGKKIAVIDTENFSSSKYADKADFDVAALTNYSVENYLKAIKEAEGAGYDVLIIDSLSHAWAGKGGVLEFVDMRTKASRDGRAAWRDATPLHNKLIDAIIQSPMHVIVTMRAKTDYVTEKDERTGKTVMRKVGLAPVQREQMEYEFDVVGTFDEDHNFVISKTRFDEIDGQVINKPGKEFGERLAQWLSDGEAVPAPTPKFEKVEIPDERVGFDDSVSASQKATVESKHKYEEPDLVERYMIAMREADSVDALQKYATNIGSDVKKGNIQPDDKAKLLRLYHARVAELTSEKLNG